MEDKNEWGSNLSFILAMIGSAVGLGNIWRYPYVLYSNGEVHSTSRILLRFF
jgi:NSS family neurotransmitter:Na+ symporter